MARWHVEDKALNNLLNDLGSPNLSKELVDVLVDSPCVRVERIVSTGHASPDRFWYDQEEAEWVVVLKGHARLLFDGDDRPIDLHPGDHVNIAPHRKHRVEWTAPDESTVWLAVFYRPDNRAR